jgi:hypothetical protein
MALPFRMGRDFATNNPFWVLELPATAAAMDIERAGKKWLALLEVGSPAALHYPTPSGPRPRSAEAVREAMAALRQPRLRVQAQAWLEWHALLEVPNHTPRFPELMALRTLPSLRSQ